MSAKSLTLFIGKVIAGALAYTVGILLGGMTATALGIQPPTLPPEVDAGNVGTILIAGSPLLVLALYAVNRELAGGWVARTAMLFFLSWIANTINNVIEAAVFSSYETGPWFSVINFTPAILLCAGVTAWLFTPRSTAPLTRATWQAFFSHFPRSQWAWRLPLAALLFMPVYYFFGLLVLPFVGNYYDQGAFGLTVPPLGILLGVLALRSLLFLLASLPIVVAWQGKRLDLILSLGIAHFVLVGLLYMLAATWMSPWLRTAHSLEILADSLVYVALLAWLLQSPRRQPQPQPLARVGV